MTTHVLQVLEAERSRRFPGLGGSRADTVLPVRQALIDEVLARVPRWPAPLDGLHVRIAQGNRLHVGAVIRVLGFRTRVGLTLRLAPAMENGRVRLFVDDRSFVASALSWLGPLMGRLPEGISLQGSQIVADIVALARRQGFDDLAALVSSASFQSEEGVLWVNARVEVPESAGTGEERQPHRSSETGLPGGTPGATARAAPGVPPFSIDELVASLAGARVDADLRLDERLVNDLVAAAHEHAQHTAGPGAPDVATTLARAVRRPTLRFEPGLVRIRAAADLDQPVAAAGEPRNT